MIKPISLSQQSFGVDKNSINRDGEYKDPLMQWPIRGAAFTNEVGEAMRPLIGDLATISWAPALLYIGADIYDKYKNDQTEYSPDSRRGLKQAIFQSLASIGLPLVAVKIGQNLFSLLGLYSKDKITINASEHISKLACGFVANGKMHKHGNNEEECIKEFWDIVSNNIDFKHYDTPLKTHLKFNKKENLKSYADKTIRDLIKLRKDLLFPSDEFKGGVWYKEYKRALESGQTSNVAVKSILNKFQQKKSMQGRFIKTIGGFLALGISINPIDRFVEDVLIGKVVAPKIEKRKHNMSC